jgi:phenylalanyl-tRNA synthetase beta chain
LAGIHNATLKEESSTHLETASALQLGTETAVLFGQVAPQLAKTFDLKQPVFVADFYWDIVFKNTASKIQYREITKYPAVARDLALVVPKETPYEAIDQQLKALKLSKLQDIRLFDVFESEKLGAGKKSMAVNFMFLDEEKTLTDKEIDGWMQRIMTRLEQELGAEIRR